MRRLLSKIVRIWSLAGLTFAVGFLGFMTYLYVVEDPRAANAQAELVSEYRAVQPFPGAVLKHYDARHQPTSALVGASYVVDADYVQLRQYYDSELARRGWLFCAEERPLSWGKDIGDMSAYYRKRDLQASLFYEGGSHAELGYTYSLSMSWGLSDRCYQASNR